jgi:zinc/manganese transport system permease protein
VRGAALGLAALFLYWGATSTSTTGATVTVLFGSIFTISASTAAVAAVFALLAVGIVAVLYRPLLLGSASPDLAFARGIPVRATGALCLVAIALAVSLSALTIGAILSTALLVGPAATALRLTSKPGLTVLWSAVIGLAATWLGVLLAYDSYYWPPVRHGWPVSFFVVALVVLFYLLAQFAVSHPPGTQRGQGATRLPAARPGEAGA